MKRMLCGLLAAGMLLSLPGCRTASPEELPAESLPRPEFPLTEETVNAALEQSGFPGEISSSETQSYQEGQIVYSLRDATRTYVPGGNAVLSAGISSSFADGERFLQIVVPLPEQEEPEPFDWEDLKPELVLAALLYGGFADEEEIYRSFCGEEFSEEQGWGQWTQDLTGGYCQVSVSRHRNPRTNQYRETRNLMIFESEEAYLAYQENVEEAREDAAQRAEEERAALQNAAEPGP